MHGTIPNKFLTSTFKANKDTMAASVPITQGMNNNSRGVVKTVILRLWTDYSEDMKTGRRVQTREVPGGGLHIQQ